MITGTYSTDPAAQLFQKRLNYTVGTAASARQRQGKKKKQLKEKQDRINLWPNSLRPPAATLCEATEPSLLRK